MVFLGIDVVKADFHCALLSDGRSRPNSVFQLEKGFERLLAWLHNRGVEHVHACLEATGGWSEELALFLHDRGQDVSLVNPMTAKAFWRSELSRTKTDKADAALIARYCSAMRPRLWEPPSPSQRRLQRLGRRRSALVEMRTQEENRLEGPGVEEVRDSLERSIAFLGRQIGEIDAEIRSVIDDDPDLRSKSDLLKSIPGIGERVAATLLGELPQITEFRNGKTLAASVGLCTHEFRSGSSVSTAWALQGRYYMPAITAMRCNPILADYAARLRGRGKRNKQIIAAGMRRLLVLAYGVLKSGRPFNAVPALDAGHGIWLRGSKGGGVFVTETRGRLGYRWQDRELALGFRALPAPKTERG
jgi:transposase